MDKLVFELDGSEPVIGCLTLYLRAGCRSLTRREGALPGCCKAAPSVRQNTRYHWQWTFALFYDRISLLQSMVHVSMAWVSSPWSLCLQTLWTAGAVPGPCAGIAVHGVSVSRGCMHSPFFLAQKSNQNAWFSTTFDFSLYFRWFSAFFPTLCTVLFKKTKLSCLGGFFSLVF